MNGQQSKWYLIRSEKQTVPNVLKGIAEEFMPLHFSMSLSIPNRRGMAFVAHPAGIE